MTLLDVNVLFALGWDHHTHHQMAKDWFDSRGDDRVGQAVPDAASTPNDVA